MAINVFISHISEEGKIALLLKEIISRDFGEHVKVLVSSDQASIDAGAIWLTTLKDALAQAHVVIILCSNASVQRPWVQFELGGAWLRGTTIIPIYHSTMTAKDLPVPLSWLEALNLKDPADLSRLYARLSKQLQSPFTPQIQDIEAVKARIDELETDFRDAHVQQYERYIDVLVPSPGRFERDSVPRNIEIESNEVSLQIFGLPGATRRVWGDIEAVARRKRDRRWLEQLEDCIAQASRDEGFRHVQAIFHTDNGSYQPQLAKKITLPDGSARFHVHFVETTVAPLMEVQNELGTLVTLLRLGMRFRFEVLERFRKRIKTMNPNGPEANRREILKQLRSAIEIIETDAESRGAGKIDHDAIVDLFDSDDDLHEMAQMFEIWTTVRTKLFHDDPEPTMDEIIDMLAKVREMNYCFLRLASRRYHEMICIVLAPKATSRRNLTPTPTDEPSD